MHTSLEIRTGNSMSMQPTPIFTIGYGSRPIEELLDLLRAQRIEYILDVRSKPYSGHRPEYARVALEQRLKTGGPRYVYMGDDLGGLPEHSETHGIAAPDVQGQTQGQAQGQAQGQTRDEAFRRGLDRLHKAFAQQARVALLCCEARPERCHRALLIGVRLADEGVPVVHIDENGEMVSQEAVLRRREAQGLGGLAEDGDVTCDARRAGAIGEAGQPDQGPPPENEAPPLTDADMPGSQDHYLEEAMEPESRSAPLPVLDLGRFAAADPATVLKQVFGYDAFRPLQAEVIADVLARRDALAIMPTGSGKSLCYQLPALKFPGLTVVVSPLIALMEDQVMQARELGLPAAFLNSTLPGHEYQAVLTDVRAGRVKLLYAAPETLLLPVILELLDSVAVDCLTIDEAHCISEWGHDFRPEYRRLMEVRRRLSSAVCLAVTATATELVRRDIKAALGIPDAQTHLASFNRDNLFLEVVPKARAAGQILDFIQNRADQAGIIYCGTRRQVDALSEVLRSHGHVALPYHAGLDAPTRMRHQRRFIRDDARIMVATIAFGMGINKSDIRYVIHHDLPKNLESYYQQVGRAGRDGLRADCLLLFSYADLQTSASFIKKMEPAQQKPARIQLEAMLGYAESAVCRRVPLLGYFNEPYPGGNCGMCDNCLAPPQDREDVTVAAQKFLSCVKRTGELFGMTHIIDVLRGSRSEKVLSRGHDALSTYNIGLEYSKKQWQRLARQFIQQGLLVQDMEHGGLRLGPEAYEVFRGRQVLGTLPEPDHLPASSSGLTDQNHDPDLFALLRARRKSLAEEANLPPYVIFSDRTLMEMATFFPQSPGSLALIHGVGETKLARYAQEFLPIIQEYCAQRGIAEQLPPGQVPRLQPESLGARTLEVLALHEQGRTIAQMCATFSVKPGTIINHLWQAFQAGRPVRGDTLESQIPLPPETLRQTLDAFAEHGPDRLRPVFEALGGAVGYDDLHLVRLHALVNGIL